MTLSENWLCILREGDEANRRQPGSVEVPTGWVRVVVTGAVFAADWSAELMVGHPIRRLLRWARGL